MDDSIQFETLKNINESTFKKKKISIKGGAGLHKKKLSALVNSRVSGSTAPFLNNVISSDSMTIPAIKTEISNTNLTINPPTTNHPSQLNLQDQDITSSLLQHAQKDLVENRHGPKMTVIDETQNMNIVEAGNIENIKTNPDGMSE